MAIIDFRAAERKMLVDPGCALVFLKRQPMYDVAQTRISGSA
jgi:hypothetical protein